MQFKAAAILLSSLVAFAAATPTAEENIGAAADEGFLSLRDADIIWFAEGGCKGDWASRCNAMCLGEKDQKKLTCQSFSSKIVDECSIPFRRKCRCTCVK